MTPSCCQQPAPPPAEPEQALSSPVGLGDETTNSCCENTDENVRGCHDRMRNGDVGSPAGQGKEDSNIGGGCCGDDAGCRGESRDSINAALNQCLDGCCQDTAGPGSGISKRAGDDIASVAVSCMQDASQTMPTQCLPNGDDGIGSASSKAAVCTKGRCGDMTPPRCSAIKQDGSDVSDCCRGKVSPCCDASCLDRVALRECEAGSYAGESSKCTATSRSDSMSGWSGPAKRIACDRHRRTTCERYGATLEAIGCICRVLLSLGMESCCETPKRSLDRKGCSKKASGRFLRSIPDSCCTSGASPRQSSTAINVALQKRASTKRGESGCSGGSCCKPSKPKPMVNTCADACCTAIGEAKVVDDTEKAPIAKARDIEKQAAGHEHVVLCISGMTCTGCETKLNRTLGTVAGVKNLKTSLILSRAEFDVDLQLTLVGDVMKHLERTTEFKCERITNNGSSIDIILRDDPAHLINQPWAAGVVDMSLVDRDVVRVTFDPKSVGARDLMEKHWEQSAKLAPIRGDPSLEAGSKHVRHVGYMTLLSTFLTIPVLVMAWAPIPKREVAYSSASLALATIVQVFVAGPFYPKALKALVFSRVIEMDLLIVLSTSAAFIFSVVSFGLLVAGNSLLTGQFFETSTLLVTLIMVGRYVAALARQKAVESISLRSLQTQTALLVDDITSEVREIDARLLQYGDSFKVLPETRIPTDGTVITGSSEVDESMITGESLPVEKHIKSSVIAGTINGSGTLVVRLTRLPGENTINTIVAMVNEAKLSKPKMQDLADRVASYFVPTIIALTIITFIIWIAIGISIRGKTGPDAAVQALTYAITVLIVSCPCAIGLAVPMVVVIASGVAAERGVIFKSADAIEVAYKASHVVFDKTGTLTKGMLAVTEDHYLGNGDVPLSLLLGLIGDSRHPVSVAVANHLRSKAVGQSAVSGTRSLTGRGLEAEVAGQMLRAGNSRWLGLSSHALVDPLLARGFTVFCFAIDDTLVAVYGLEDSLRDEARHVTQFLQSHGVSVHIVSGDENGAVQRVATKLGIPGNNIRAHSSPSDKQVYIKSLLADASNGNKPVVIFCGDGTNDAVALAQATIGVHMNQGSDVAQSAADVVLMRPDLSGILTMMNASKQSVRRIKFNFAWSFVYNTFAILLAAGAFVKARIPPEFGGLGELVSVLPVIIAAVLLRWSKI